MTETPEFTLDWPHGHMTRDGRKSEIFCERDGMIWGRVKHTDGAWFAIQRLSSGEMHLGSENCFDIINRSAPKPPLFEDDAWAVLQSEILIRVFNLQCYAEEYVKRSDQSNYRIVHVKLTEITE